MSAGIPGEMGRGGRSDDFLRFIFRRCFMFVVGKEEADMMIDLGSTSARREAALPHPRCLSPAHCSNPFEPPKTTCEHLTLCDSRDNTRQKDGINKYMNLIGSIVSTRNIEFRSRATHPRNVLPLMGVNSTQEEHRKQGGRAGTQKFRGHVPT